MAQKPMLRAEVYAHARAIHTVIELPFHLNQTLRSLHAIVFPADSIPSSSLMKSLSLAVYPYSFFKNQVCILLLFLQESSVH